MKEELTAEKGPIMKEEVTAEKLAMTYNPRELDIIFRDLIDTQEVKEEVEETVVEDGKQIKRVRTTFKEEKVKVTEEEAKIVDKLLAKHSFSRDEVYRALTDPLEDSEEIVEEEKTKKVERILWIFKKKIEGEVKKKGGT